MLEYSRGFLQFTAHNDSWKPMRAALVYLHTTHTQPLYQHLFFDRRIKFQYAPTSILWLELLGKFPYRNLTTNWWLNSFSWVIVVATIVVVLRIFNLSVEQNLKQAEGNWAERMARSLLAVCFALTFYPLVRSFFLGQIQTWITFLFATVVLLWMAGHKTLAGVATGLICSIKPQLAPLLLWGLLRKQWGFAAGLAVTGGAPVVLSLWHYGLADNLDYLNVLLFVSKHGESFYPNQSVNGLMNRMLFNGNNLVWDGANFAPYNIWVHLGTLASSILIIGAALFWRSKDRLGGVIDLLIATLSCTMASPIVWEHHYGVMLPMFAVALPLTLSLRLAPRGIIWLAASFFFTSNYFQFTDHFSPTHWNFLQSYLLLGAVLLLVYLYYLRHKLVRVRAAT